MRRHLVVPLTMLAIGICASASAQVVFSAAPVLSGPQATREDVVARLMSFDLNHDGRVARAELPERLHSLLTRGDVNNDQTLDATETFRLAEQPLQVAVVRGFQPGQYGFGDGFGLDSRLHIEGAIDDLRLAASEREKALDIARRFDATRQEKAKHDLRETMAAMLTNDSLADFMSTVDRAAQASVRPFPVMSEMVTVVAGPQTVRQPINRVVSLRAAGRVSSAILIDKYGLQPREQERAIAAIERYNETTKGISDVDRQTLLDELRPLLGREQLDDLRAALERRPIVKQNGAVFVLNGESVALPTGTVHLDKLVLTN